MSNTREIKFRAWQPPTTSEPFVVEQGYMATQGDPDLETLSSFMHHYSESKHLMQYTGLKDKNGKEVYEGDIVWTFGNDIRHAVIFFNGGFGYNPYEAYPDIDFHFISFAGNINFEWANGQSERIEIIGNIYENPELLKAKSA